MNDHQPQRLLSLDAFRGFTIAAMLLVNDPGDWAHLYGPLEHAAWNGWTFTDWIFPFFVFISGISMTISLGRRAAQRARRRARFGGAAVDGQARRGRCAGGRHRDASGGEESSSGTAGSEIIAPA